ncbi:hypothetical protein DRO60_00260 [Candidatus Bathyarchaeota archaeon]|nr:MAG: hypothetical protein DRO60_00260 [Candidatus Bathyarchaeota archaeon]
MYEPSARERAKGIIVRVLKAMLAGVIAYITSYVIPQYLFGGLLRAFGGAMPPGALTPSELLVLFATIVVFFTVAIELTRDTVFEHALAIGRAITLLFFFIYAAGGGVVHLTLTPELGVPVPMEITIDATKLLFMIVGINLLEIGKSLVSAVYEISERVDRELERELERELRR